MLTKRRVTNLNGLGGNAHTRLILERPLTRYTHLSDNDVSAVLKSSGLDDHSPEDVERLKRAINRTVSFVDHARTAVSPIGPRIKALREIGDALASALRALRSYPRLFDYHIPIDLETGITGRAPPPATFDAWRAAYPAEEDLLWVHTLCHDLRAPLPSGWARAVVRSACGNLDLLLPTIKAQLGADLQAQTEHGSKTRPHRPDYAHYLLINELVGNYEEFFKVRAVVTRGGRPCRFLAAVLNRCDRKRSRRVTADAAYNSWLATRKWQSAISSTQA